jgi:peptide/nickel transport system substrate-binding protein
MGAHIKSLKDLPYDPAKAKALLTEAGYANGFQLTLHGSNDRFVKADSVLQAIAQMLQRAGVDARVEVMPHSVFRSRGAKLEFSAQFGGWAADDVSSPLRSLLATSNRDKGFGAANRGPHSSPQFDDVLTQALATFDDGARAALFDKAGTLAVEELGLVPLYFELATWGMKAKLDYKFNVNQETLAQSVTRRP